MYILCYDLHIFYEAWVRQRMVAGGPFISQRVIPFHIVVDRKKTFRENTEKGTSRKHSGHALYDQKGEDYMT